MEEEINIKKKRRNKLWIILPVLIICIIFISLVNAGVLDDFFNREKKSDVLFTKITPTSMKVCNDKTCTITLYSGTRYVNEDNSWKEIEKAKDLKDSGIKCNVKFDGINEVNCLDYNLTSMTLELSRKTSGDSPIKIYEYNETKSQDTGKKEYDLKLEEPYSFENIYVNRSLPDCKTSNGSTGFGSESCNSEGENKTEIKYEEEKIVLILDTKYGDIVHFGDKSTTIELQDANTENLADIGLGLDVSGDIDYSRILIKFNISSISNYNILNSYLSFKSSSVGGSWNGNLSIYRINNQTWGESNTFSQVSILDRDSLINMNSGFNSIGGWANTTNITSIINQEILGDNSFVSFWLEDPDNNSTQDTIYDTTALVIGSTISNYDNMIFYSREYATSSSRPKLVVTYDIKSYDFTYLFNGIDTTTYSNLNGTADGVTFDDVNLFYKLIQGNTSGNFTSNIFDLTGSNTFGNISWIQDAPYQQELPNDQSIESVYGGANMTGNILLLHMNEEGPLEFPNNQAVGWFNMTGNVLLLHTENNLVENSGLGHTVTSNTSLSYTSDSKAGNYSLSLTNNKFLNVSDHDNLDFGSDERFSMGAWVLVDNRTKAGSLLTKIDIHSPYTGYQLIQQVGGSLWVEFVSEVTELMRVNSSVMLESNKWYHVAMTYSGTNSADGIKIYINGVDRTGNILYNESFATPSSMKTNLPFQVGIRDSSYLPFSGDLDEIAVWNRTLSPTEVASIYDQQAPKFLDNSGLGNNGTGFGAKPTTISKLGNHAGGFDGVNDYVETPNINIGTGEVTFMVWAKSDSNIPINNEYGIISAYNSTNSFFFTLERNTWVNTTTIYVGYNYQSPNSINCPNRIWDTNDTSWHYVGVTRNSTEMVLYFDGVRCGNSSHTNFINFNVGNKPIRIGAPSGLYFNGSIDEVAVWNRSLSKTEIQNLYLRGAVALNLSVRSCNDELCDTEIWNGTYINSSYVDISDLTPNRYFQYKFDFTTYDTDFTPKIYNVTMNYVNSISDTCSYPGAGTWTVSCSDNCVVTTQYIVDGNLSLNGAGNFTLKANLTFNDSSNEQFIFNNGCSFINNAFIIKND